MGNMRDINSEKQDDKKQEFILRKDYYPGLLKANRRLTWLSLALMAIVLLLGYLLFPANNLLKTYENAQTSAELYKVPMNPVLSAEIDALKVQLIGLISGSIESKLRTLETSVRTGKVSAADLGTIQDLKNDVQVLKTYSATGAGRLIAEPYATQSKTKIEVKDQLLNEVSQLKQLIYISIASCGLMFAAAGGIWLRQSRLSSDSARLKKAGLLLEGKKEQR